MEEKKSNMGQIKDLPIGGSVVFPIEKSNTIKSTSQMVSAQFDRRYATHMNRKERTIIVTRVS